MECKGNHMAHSKVYDRKHLPKHIVLHSPTGMNWGYGGSGPADLALSLLAAVVGKNVALQHYQKFKWDIVSKFDDNWSIMASDIRAWVDAQEKE